MLQHTGYNRKILKGAPMSLSIQLPDNLEQQLTIYCQQHHLSKNETIRLALERLLTMVNKPLTPYELGKDGFGSDQTHEGDIAQHTKDLLKARFTNNADR
ncbi:MAG: hypothetical protein RIQ94_2422 [Pseudomonadota bacterium]|jgi:hypothetical protein